MERHLRRRWVFPKEMRQGEVNKCQTTSVKDERQPGTGVRKREAERNKTTETKDYRGKEVGWMIWNNNILTGSEMWRIKCKILDVKEEEETKSRNWLCAPIFRG